MSKWFRNPSLINALIKTEYPIIQAPMAFVTSPELVASVSNVGGLGSIAAAYLTPQQIVDQIRQVKQLTSKPFAINLFASLETKGTVDSDQRQHLLNVTNTMRSRYELSKVSEVKVEQSSLGFTFQEQVDAILSEGVAVFSFTLGIPSQHVIDSFKTKGIAVIGTANTVEEAELLERAGVDAVVAQGAEAGGHRASFIGLDDDQQPLFALVPQIANKLKIPVIAAGGIMDGNGVVSAIAMGAKGVQMGTAFIPCEESLANPLWKQTLIDGSLASTHGTVVTKSITGKYARWLRNKIVRELHPYQNGALPFGEQKRFIEDITKVATNKHDVEMIPMFSGMNGVLCHKLPRDAKQLVLYIVKDTVQTLDRLLDNEDQIHE
jgi:nitronate monooxygenase